MDVLIRYHRMRGFNTLWQVGHRPRRHRDADRRRAASSKREGQIAARPRPREVRRARLGVEGAVRLHDHAARCAASARRPTGRASASRWTRACRARCVETFVRLYEDGLIYRGKRLVNWDPVLRHGGVGSRGRQRGRARHALGDPLSARPTAAGRVVVATTRPETMLGDVAVAVQPGRRALPRAHRQAARRCRSPAATIPVIADDYVDREFGTGVREDHAGARLQRLAGRPAPRARR